MLREKYNSVDGRRVSFNKQTMQELLDTIGCQTCDWYGTKCVVETDEPQRLVTLCRGKFSDKLTFVVDDKKVTITKK